MRRPTAGLARLVAAARGAARLGVAICRELSDERAYARHLAQHGRPPSPEEWRRFSDERFRAKFMRSRCC